MPVTADKPAPYAPPKAVLDIIERLRTRGLPAPVNGEVLTRAGISESLVQRTLQALQTLDLIDEAGNHSEVLEGLRLAPEAEIKQRMTEWLNNAYSDVLKFIDPAKDDETRIRDAFRPYKPTGQQDRMVTLFSGLYTAAAVRPEKSSVTKPRVARSSSPAPQRRKPTPQKLGGDAGIEFPGSRPLTGMPPALVGLLSSLPVNGGGWTQEKRDKFIETFGVVIDFCYPIVEPEEPDFTNTNGGQ